MTDFSLAHQTVLSLPPPEAIRVAARTGYRSVGLRLLRVTDQTPGYPLMDDPAMMRATQSAMAETGISVLDIEFVRLLPETDVRTLVPLLEAGATLRARHVITAAYDPDLNRLADRFAALCELAEPLGLSMLLEFFPWTSVPTVADANVIVEAARRPNAGILVDVLHFDRGASTLAQLDTIPPSRLPFVHVCDAPGGSNWTTAQLLHTARGERLLPGEGDIDIRSILARMPPRIPIGLEVSMLTLTAEIGPEAVAKRAIDAAIRLLGDEHATGHQHPKSHPGPYRPLT